MVPSAGRHSALKSVHQPTVLGPGVIAEGQMLYTTITKDTLKTQALRLFIFLKAVVVENILKLTSEMVHNNEGAPHKSTVFPELTTRWVWGPDIGHPGQLRTSPDPGSQHL